MDDEEDIRYIFTKMLDRVHYEVEVAGDGNEAIELFKGAISSNEPFVAVIMDLKVADGMGGEEAIKRLLEIDPGTKIILSSGSIDDQVVKDFGKYGISAVLRKPFKNEDLIKVLRKVISE
jgi:CheY-like chemotaxis protein